MVASTRGCARARRGHLTNLGTAVLHTVRGDEALRALQERIRQLQENGRRALVITCLQPATTLIGALSNVDGIDAETIGFIDCTGEGQPDEVGDDILFIDSPTMVEAILVRTDRLLRRMGNETAVIVYTLDTFTLYVDTDLVVEFGQCLMNNLQGKGVDVEFISVEGDESRNLAERIQVHVDVALMDA